MNRLLTFTVCAAALALTACAAAAAPATTPQAIDAEAMRPAHSDISAQTKTWRHKTVRPRSGHRAGGYRVHGGDPTRSPYYLRPGVAPSFGYIGPPGYAGEYAWRRSIGQCVEDLGYGRWSACGAR